MYQSSLRISILSSHHFELQLSLLVQFWYFEFIVFKLKTTETQVDFGRLESDFIVLYRLISLITLYDSYSQRNHYSSGSHNFSGFLSINCDTNKNVCNRGPIVCLRDFSAAIRNRNV